MFQAMERGDLTAVYCIGENPASSEADATHATQAARGPRLPDRPGHLPDEDRRDRRRGAPGVERRVRVRGDRDELRAARAAGPQGARAARQGEGRHLDHRAAGEAPRVRLGRGRRAFDAWEELRIALADARGDVVASAWRSWAGSSGRAPTSRTPARRSSTRGCGGRPGAAGAKAPFSVVIDEPPVDELSRGVPAPPDHGPPAGLVQHGRADAAATRRRCGAARRSSVSPEDAASLGRRRGRGRARSRRGAATVEAPVHDRSRRSGRGSSS